MNNSTGSNNSGLAKGFSENISGDEKFFTRLFENCPFVMLLVEADTGAVANANQAAVEFYGWEKKDLVQMNISRIDSLYHEEVNKNKSQKSFEFESRHILSDGKTADVEVVAGDADIPGKNIYYFTVFDITEKKKNEQQLKLLSLSVDQSPALIVITDINGNIEYVNSEFTRVTGYSFNEVKGKNPRILQSGKHTKGFYNTLWNNLLSGRDWKGEFCNKKKNKELYWEKAHISPVLDSEGEITNFIAIKEDITEKKNIVNELVAAKEDAQTASKAKSEFIAAMSHELRTPLNGVIGFSELLRMTPLNEDQQNYAETIISSANLLLGVINDILDFSKIEAGKLELEKIKTDIRLLLEQSVDNIRFTAEEKNLEVLLDIDEEMPDFAYIDSVRLRQVLGNLLGNAVKFTEKGEVELKVSFEKIGPGRCEFTFNVRDTGIGITKDQQKRLFQSFTQGDGSTTRKFGGTGLGLIISDMIVKEMGGRIKFESEPGKGSLFYFTITAPVARGEEKIFPELSKIKKSLVIDDNEKSRDVLKNMLSKWDIECLCCQNSGEAAELIEKGYSFDTVFVDYNMPEKKGTRAASDIRRLYEKDLPPEFVILHSSMDSSIVQQECAENKINFRLIKPIRTSELYECLANINDSEYMENILSSENDTAVQSFGLISEKNIKILIAEDNYMNMLFAKSLVEKLIPGCEIIEAENGKEAVTAAKTYMPDLILMDFQMPEMSGNEAVKEIRISEEKTGQRVPVIGLTAVAVNTELEKSMAFGMDDFVTKPVDVEKLKSVLKKYLDLSGSEAEAELKKKQSEDSLKHFDKSAFWNMVDDDEVYDEMLEVVKKEMPGKIYAAEKAISENNLEKAGQLLHSIKGTALNMRFHVLSDLIDKIEKSIIISDFESLHTDFEEIKNEWENILSYLN
ncbi:MAG: response regulator [Thermodesulfobacteriota bacterium]